MKKRNKENSNYSLAHVLYQKLGNDWYAFTEVDGDCFMSKVDAAAVKKDEAEEPGDKTAADSSRRKAA